MGVNIIQIFIINLYLKNRNYLIKMEAILNKRKQKLIKEGLNIIDSFEEYTRKNNPDTYKKYLTLKEEKLIGFSDKWSQNMRVLEDIKRELNERNFDFLETYDDMFTEMENYVNTFKPKVFLERENFNQIFDIVNIINEIRKLPDQSRINYAFKCIPFFSYTNVNGAL